jgi:hypothetical protein
MGQLTIAVRPSCPEPHAIVPGPGYAGGPQRCAHQGGRSAARLVGSTCRGGEGLCCSPDSDGWFVAPSRQPLRREPLRDLRRHCVTGPGGRFLGCRGSWIRYPQQFLPGCLRSLHADRLGQDTDGGLRRRHRSKAGGLGVQLRPARKRHRLPTLLDLAGHSGIQAEGIILRTRQPMGHWGMSHLTATFLKPHVCDPRSVVGNRKTVCET